MKKKFLLLLTALFIGFVGLNNVNAGTIIQKEAVGQAIIQKNYEILAETPGQTVGTHNQRNVFVTMISKEDGVTSAGSLAAGQKFGYCMNLEAEYGSGAASELTQTTANLGDAQILRMRKAANLGPKATTDTNYLVKYYAAQRLLYEAEYNATPEAQTPFKFVSYTVANGGTVSPTDIQTAYTGMLAEYNEYDTLPSVCGQTIQVTAGEGKTVVDTKGVLSKYTLTGGNGKVAINGNNLVITDPEVNINDITLTRGSVDTAYYGTDGWMVYRINGANGTGVYQDIFSGEYSKSCTLSVSVLDIQKGMIKVIKVDKDNHEVKIPNVTFEVKNATGDIVATLVTDENGVAQTGILELGDYTVTETKAGTGYKLNETPQTVTLTAGEITEMTFEDELENVQTGDIPIYIVWGVGIAALGYSVFYLLKSQKLAKNKA